MNSNTNSINKFQNSQKASTGLTDETSKLVIVDVDLSQPQNKHNVIQHSQDEEQNSVEKIKLKDFRPGSRKFEEMVLDGGTVGYLYTFAQGLSIGGMESNRLH